MKNLITISLVTAVLLGNVSCKKANVSKEPEVKQNIAVVAKSETASFTIAGMSCAVMCANKIEKELSSLKGVQKATVNFEKKQAIVTFDSSQISAEKLVSTVEAVAGGSVYKVSDLRLSANKAMLFQEKEKTRKERRAEKKAKKAADAASTAATPAATTKSGCCSGKKVCGKDEKATTL